jgi:cytochrome bd-type quinol oxidase subunit 1
MNQADAAPANVVPVTWSRRALVGLFLVAFVVAAVGLVARWDTLMVRLAEPPVSTPPGEATR